MYKLYWRERSGAFAPAAVMAELDIRYEAIHLDKESRAHERDDYMALNPLGKIPTLILPGGGIMTESAAIALFLAEERPETGLAPPVGDRRRPQLLRWLFFAQCNIYETDLRFTYPDRYTTNPKGGDGVAEAARRHFAGLWRVVAAEIQGPFFFGEEMTVLDIYLAMLGTWHNDPPALYRDHPAVGRLVEAVATRATIAPVWHQYAMAAKIG